MKITIIERDAGTVGGRQDDAVEHARLFLQRGHDVTLLWGLGGELHSRYASLRSEGIKTLFAAHGDAVPRSDAVVVWAPVFANERPQNTPGLVRVIAPERQQPDFTVADDPKIVRYCTNTETMQGLLERFYPVTRGRIERMPSLVDYAGLPPGRRDRERDVTAVWIGYRATYGDGTDKGWPVFVRLAKRYPRKQFVAISTDTLHTPDPPPNVAVRVEIARNEVAEILGRSRFFVMPSEVESAPNAVVEALACGAWPIAYDRGAIRELVGGVSTLVSKERDLFEAFEHLFGIYESNDSWRRSMRLRAMRWDRAVWADNAMKVVEGVAALAQA